MRLLVSTWSDGVFVVDGNNITHEQAGRDSHGMAGFGDGSLAAIIDHHGLYRRDRNGVWTELARSEASLSSCAISRGEVFVGDDTGARLWRFVGGALDAVAGFDATPGRDTWYAGKALVDGKWMGPPIGIRSLSASCDGATLLANVHVGGIPRSTDRGATWHPTIDVEADVHQVAFHPSRPEIAIAAAAVGLCSSRDGGATWRIETTGLHASYCSAVAFIGDDVYVAASESHFAEQGAIYRRPVDGTGPLEPVDGLPRWMSGIVDTATMTASGRSAAIVDGGGNVYLSQDAGRGWTQVAHGLPQPSGALIVT